MSAALLSLVLAVVGLLVGPVLYGMPHWKAWDRVLDSFTVVAVGGLCVLHLLPEAIAHGGWLAAICAAVGLFAPRFLRGASGTGLLVGLMLHAALEAGAMNAAHGHGALGLAVVLHRVPVGLAVFSMYHEHPHTNRRGWFAIALLMLATVLGFFFGGWLSGVSGPVEAALNASVAGLLLHVVWEHESDEPEHDHDHAQRSRGGPIDAMAALVGLVVVGVMGMSEVHAEHNLLQQVAALTSYTAAPALAVYAAMGGLYVARDRTTAARRLALLIDRTLPWFWLAVVVVAAFVSVGPGSRSPLTWLPVGAIFLLTIVSLVRHGPRGMVAMVTRQSPHWMRG